jgi:hypothetical protein
MPNRSLRMLAAAALLVPLGGAAAQTTPYYSGKQIRLVIGSGVGGGYGPIVAGLSIWARSYSNT